MRLFHLTLLIVSLGLMGCKLEMVPDTASNVVIMPDDIAHSSGGTTSKLTAAFEGQPSHARQSLESMMSLLDLKSSQLTTAELNSLNSESTFRRDLLVAQSDLSQISPSTVIATTSLAGNVCKVAVSKEKAGKKDLFRYLDFNVGPATNGKAKAMNTYLLMAERFWSRKPSNEELSLLNEQIELHWKSLTSAALSQTIETERLAISICAGMLSAPESYIF